MKFLSVLLPLALAATSTAARSVTKNRASPFQDVPSVQSPYVVIEEYEGDDCSGPANRTELGGPQLESCYPISNNTKAVYLVEEVGCRSVMLQADWMEGGCSYHSDSFSDVGSCVRVGVWDPAQWLLYRTCEFSALQNSTHDTTEGLSPTAAPRSITKHGIPPGQGVASSGTTSSESPEVIFYEFAGDDSVYGHIIRAVLGGSPAGKRSVTNGLSTAIEPSATSTVSRINDMSPTSNLSLVNNQSITNGLSANIPLRHLLAWEFLDKTAPAPAPPSTSREAILATQRRRAVTLFLMT